MSGVHIDGFKPAIFGTANSPIFIPYNMSTFWQKASSLFMISFVGLLMVKHEILYNLHYSLHIPTANVIYATLHRALHSPREIIITEQDV